MQVPGEGSPVGKENIQNQAHSRRGRGLNGTHVDNNVGEATQGKGHKNQKEQQQQNSCLKYTELECLYTNADSFINKFSAFKERIKLSDFKIMGITEVKPKNQRFPITPTE